MYYKVEEIVRDVRVAIDQNRSSESLIAIEDIDTLSLDELIREKLEDAARLVLGEAPAQLLESGHIFTDKDDTNVYIDSATGKGFVILPSDFLRLISFRMSDWSRTVYESDVIGERDARYRLQSSKWKGVYGTPEKPVVALLRRAEGLVLEFYSCKDGAATSVQATYQPMPRIDGDGMLDLPEGCYRATVYRAGGLALASMGDQLGMTLTEISRSLLEG